MKNWFVESFRIFFTDGFFPEKAIFFTTGVVFLSAGVNLVGGITISYWILFVFASVLRRSGVNVPEHGGEPWNSNEREKTES